MSARRKRWYLALMLLGGVALIVDRMVGWGGSAPSPAEASTHAIPVPAEEVNEVAIPELPFPRELKPVVAGAHIPDLFARPGSLSQSADADNPASSGAVPPSPNHTSAGNFMSVHQLNGLRLDARLRIANVDGRWMGTGAVIGGCELGAINAHSVVFECFDGPAELTLDKRRSGTRAKVGSGAGR